MGCLAGPCKWKLILPAMNTTHWAKKQTVTPKSMKIKYLIMTSYLKLRGKIQHKTRIADSSRSISSNSFSVFTSEHFLGQCFFPVKPHNTDLWLRFNRAPNSRDELVLCQYSQLRKDTISNYIFRHFVTRCLPQQHIIWFHFFSQIDKKSQK